MHFTEDLSETLDPQHLPTTCESQCTSKKRQDTIFANKIYTYTLYPTIPPGSACQNRSDLPVVGQKTARRQTVGLASCCMSAKEAPARNCGPSGTADWLACAVRIVLTGHALEPTWARIGTENAPIKHCSRCGVVFRRFRKDL